MDRLHTVLRSLRGDVPPRRDHISVFREFLSHLDRMGRRHARNQAREMKKTSPGKRGRKRRAR